MAITKLVQDFIKIHSILKETDLHLINAHIIFNMYEFYVEYKGFTSDDFYCLYYFIMNNDWRNVIFLIENEGCPQYIKDKVELLELLD